MKETDRLDCPSLLLPMEPDVKVENGAETVLGAAPPGETPALPNGQNGLIGGTCPLALPFAAESPLPQPVYLLKYGRVMTDEQMETLRRQISVYATICSQLVEMHKAVMAQQSIMPSMMAGQQLLYDPLLGARSSGRQRWTPSQIQLQILENLFEKCNGTPSKQKIKEITAELGQHGPLSETNVYNWFQNRKARAKRKQHPATQKDAESEVDTDEVESRKDKRVSLDTSQENQGFASFALDGSFGVMIDEKPNTANHIFENLEGAHSTLFHHQGDIPTGFDEGFIRRSQSDFGTIVVLIDGKPWEVPSGVLDFKGSFGEEAVLLDSQRQIVVTDETGFTINPLHAGESYTLVKLDKAVGQMGPDMGSEQ